MQEHTQTYDELTALAYSNRNEMIIPLPLSATRHDCHVTGMCNIGALPQLDTLEKIVVGTGVQLTNDGEYRGIPSRLIRLDELLSETRDTVQAVLSYSHVPWSKEDTTVALLTKGWTHLGVSPPYLPLLQQARALRDHVQANSTHNSHP